MAGSCGWKGRPAAPDQRPEASPFAGYGRGSFADFIGNIKTRGLPAARPAALRSPFRLKRAPHRRFPHVGAVAAIIGGVLAIAALGGFVIWLALHDRGSAHDRRSAEHAVARPGVSERPDAKTTTATKDKAIARESGSEPLGQSGLESSLEPPADSGPSVALAETPAVSHTVTVQPEDRPTTPELPTVSPGVRSAPPLPAEAPIADDIGATQVTPPADTLIETRLPIPSESAQKEAERQIRDAFEAQFTEAESASQRLE